jgi:thymidylate synthase
MSSAHRTEGNCTLEFQNWIRVTQNPEEQQYLDLVREVLYQGKSRPDRTGVGVLSTFGKRMEFDLSSGRFPLLTTKRVFFRGVVEELLWFLRGDTDAKLLQNKGIRIWDGNASRAYLDSIGLINRTEGDLGPVYGFQWRHFGAEYKGCGENYEGQGVDQIASIIRQITKTPHDRRIILSAWNPADLDKMALPPCHMFSQFYVENGHLSCQMYQRSCDLGLGVPFNIASYALLVKILAHVCKLQPGKLLYILGDTHVYNSHIGALQEQIKRTPNTFPSLEIIRDDFESNSESNSKLKFDWSKWSVDDFQLKNYQPQGELKMQMAV